MEGAGARGSYGIREFVVGTGGYSHHAYAVIAANSHVRNKTTHGVLARNRLEVAVRADRRRELHRRRLDSCHPTSGGTGRAAASGPAAPNRAAQQQIAAMNSRIDSFHMDTGSTNDLHHQLGDVSNEVSKTGGHPCDKLSQFVNTIQDEVKKRNSSGRGEEAQLASQRDQANQLFSASTQLGRTLRCA